MSRPPLRDILGTGLSLRDIAGIFQCTAAALQQRRQRGWSRPAQAWAEEYRRRVAVEARLAAMAADLDTALKQRDELFDALREARALLVP